MKLVLTFTVQQSEGLTEVKRIEEDLEAIVEDFYGTTQFINETIIELTKKFKKPIDFQALAIETENGRFVLEEKTI